MIRKAGKPLVRVTRLEEDGEPARLGASLRHLLVDPQPTLCFCVASDRLLLAQAEREGLLLISADQAVARCLGPVRHRDSF